MATTSTEPLLPSSLRASSDGAAVGLAEASGDGAISVAAASETIAHNGNDRNDGDNGEGDAAMRLHAQWSYPVPLCLE
jgi:hypothetical protein